MGMKVNGSTGLTFPDSTTMSTGSQAVRAWVNFNGTGTVAIRASYNVTSITDNGTGNYTVNFTTAMPDANYSVSGASGYAIGVSADMTLNVNTDLAFTTASFSVTTQDANPTLPSATRRDVSYAFVQVFR